MAFLFPVQVAQVEWARPIIVGYYPEWGIYGHHFNVADTPAEALDVINYAFANVVGGEIALNDPWADVQKPYPGDANSLAVKGNFHQLLLLKGRNPQLRSLISIGGWTLSGSFSDVALTDASRKAFAASVVGFIKRYGFDGADIDWEYPVGGGLNGNTNRPVDKPNFTLLLAEMRSELDAQGAADGRKYYLSAALPAGADKIANLEIRKISHLLDWANLMAYDFHGGWENTTTHQAAVYFNPLDPGGASNNVDAAVTQYLNGGMPASKLILGIPAYGRSWKSVKAGANCGLFQAAGGVPQGTWDDTGVFDYKDLVAKTKTAPAVWTRCWDSSAQAPWIYVSTLNSGTFVTYEDSQSLVFKLNYLRIKGLGGVMIWDLSSDVANPSECNSLVGKARQTFGPNH